MKYNRSKFKYSNDRKVWHNANNGGHSVADTLIKGDRMVHATFGIDAYGFCWAGSKLNHWHCMCDMTFDAAYNWVLQGEGDVDGWFNNKE